MTPYDEAAATYDRHFRRVVDLWENEVLGELLAPVVAGRRVLDLGCGTGWLADHLAPADYTGVDCSGPMLAELSRKHPDATVVKAEVGAPRWQETLGWPRTYQVVTATWSLEYLGELAALLAVVKGLTEPGGVLALHGSFPRGHRRAHFSVKAAPYKPIGPHQVRAASVAAKLPRPRITGTSALPDGAAGLGRGAWRTALRVPAGMHYAALWRWDL